MKSQINPGFASKLNWMNQEPGIATQYCSFSFGEGVGG
jgi:hypothetical protein